MKQFCQSVLANKQVTQEAVMQFISEYLDQQNTTYDSKELLYIIQLIKAGYFDLTFAVEKYCRTKGWQIRLLTHNNNIIKVWIDDN